MGRVGIFSAGPVCSSSTTEGLGKEGREGLGKSAAVGDVYFFYVGSCGNVDSVLGFASAAESKAKQGQPAPPVPATTLPETPFQHRHSGAGNRRTSSRESEIPAVKKTVDEWFL